MAAQGHTQVKIPGPDGREGKRVPLGLWPEAADQFRDQEWHGQLFGAFRASMAALQRHEISDSDALMAKASNATPVPKDERERFEYRHLDREMGVLEAAAENFDKTITKLAAARNSLSPFAAPIDKADANTAAMRTELRGYLRSLPPLDRLKALRADVDEVTASAILSAPPHLSGLSGSEWENFREGRLRYLHPQKMQSLDVANTASALVRRCLDAAKQSTRVRIAPFLPPVEPEPRNVTTPWVA